ncbi:acyl-CoA dehydrogenase family protein [Streptomyces sp. NPDC048512]|uniref:acyl-CoA dehydrogenase family protein n=1 Tax=unclassified Streptomyces TaxID=2593676 RepID=UPI0009C11B00|nr:acyl-CoA dehydrogenase family protein [Streptomyces sp. M41(2017)]OQQ19417.1 oxidoreductase [Streptomyces sp. M41(2017)]
MRSLDAAREICESYLPGLLKNLDDIPLADLEKPDSPGLTHFRTAKGPGLVIPKEYQGAGADPLQALAVVRAIGAVSPSLAVATTMHHFSVATLFTLADSIKSSGMEWALLEGIAEQNLLVASGFAEGKPSQGILTPTMRAERAEGGFVINGSKKPCSLSRSMDLLTASVALPTPDGGSEMAVLLVPRQTDGITSHPFWQSWALAGAESNEVRLTDVFVDEQLIMRTELGEAGELDELQTVGFIWFELLISAAYVGMVSALVERLYGSGRGGESDRASLIAKLETANLLLEGVARMVMDGERGNEALAKTLVARYAVQDALGETVNRAVELLGGMAFITSSDVAYLAAVSHGLTFHPPSRTSFQGPFLEHVAGKPLRLA